MTVKVTGPILAGLEKVRASSEVCMFEIENVIEVCRRNGDIEAAEWVEHNKYDYYDLLYEWPEVVDEIGNVSTELPKMPVSKISQVRDVLVKKVFAELRMKGLICEAGYGCCQPCEKRALKREMKEHPGVNGAVFWSGVDEANFLKYGKLHLTFFAKEDDEKASREIGEIVMKELIAAGLTAYWNGDPHRGILVGCAV